MQLSPGPRQVAVLEMETHWRIASDSSLHGAAKMESSGCPRPSAWPRISGDSPASARQWPDVFVVEHTFLSEPRAMRNPQSVVQSTAGEPSPTDPHGVAPCDVPISGCSLGRHYSSPRSGGLLRLPSLVSATWSRLARAEHNALSS